MTHHHFFPLRVLKSFDDYQRALAHIEQLIARDPAPGTRAAERIELLAVLIEHYEGPRYPFAPPDALEAIHFRMREGALRPRDLVPYIGQSSHVSEVLSGKRALSLAMIRRLHEGLGIPLHALVGVEKK